MVMERRPTATALRTLPGRAEPPAPGDRWRRLARLLGRYLAVSFVLLVLVYATGAARATTADPPWHDRRERVEVAGGGVLNAWARTAMAVTAWSTRGAVERQRALHAGDPLGAALGGGTSGLGGWRERNRLLLEAGTILAIAALVGYGLVGNPRRRTWLMAALLLLAASAALTRPASTLRLAAVPAGAVGELSVRAFGAIDPARAGTAPDGRPRPSDPASIERDLADSYWGAFVADPLSRLQTGTPVLAAARPEAKPGLLGQLRDGIAAVDDWAVGRRGPERAFIATSALVYALPFALVIGALATMAACAKALVLVLATGGLVALPLCAERRWRGPVARYWLAPLGAALLVLATASLLSLMVMRLAELVRGADQQLGLLLAGSALPVALAAWLARRLWARWRGRAGRPGGGWRPRLALLGGGAR